MRAWQLILLMTISGVLALSSGWRPLFVIFYVMLFSMVVSLLMSLWSTSRLAFARTLPGGRVPKGEVLEERLRLENRSWLPKIWVQINDNSTLPGHHAGYVANMGGYKRIDWRVRTRCMRRGRFFVGPVTVTTGDPLGLFTRTMPLASQRELLVLPVALPLTTYTLLPGAMSGRGRGTHRSAQLTTNAVSVRDYVPGDALTRIHWPLSAHHSQLMVKEFDLDPTIDVWLVLDMQSSTHAGTGDESTVEYAVQISATLAQYFIRAEMSVGLIINDREKTVLALDRGERQLDRIFEQLALAQASTASALNESLILHESRFTHNCVLVVITPSVENEWVLTVGHLVQRGVYANVIALDSASFGGEWSNEDMQSMLTNGHIPTVLVHQGDDLVQALTSGSTFSGVRQ
jgi:uncharacterized protein (DUF58 family)